MTMKSYHGDRWRPLRRSTSSDVAPASCSQFRMRQLLIRIPDELHRRLTDTAAETGHSVNAIVLDDDGAVVPHTPECASAPRPPYLFSAPHSSAAHD
jgi:hypothetical protein